MEPIDNQLLNEMREAMAAYRRGQIEVGSLVDQLLLLRDRLQIRDHTWSQELTQHIATLDSASTFVPKGDVQVRQLSSAMAAAIDGLLKLLEGKLA
jgi:hypothetical protein